MHSRLVVVLLLRAMRRPTDQSSAVFGELSRKLAELPQQFDGIVRADVAWLNDRLREWNLEPVK